jgi:signal transduction histidine kinase
MNTQGIGLGLVISDNIIKAFDGQIGVRSVFGKGTKFVFSILLKDKLERTEKETSSYNERKAQKLKQ